MPDLDTQIRTWVDRANAGVEPITVAEITQRADTIDLTPNPTQHRAPRPLTIAATLITIAIIATAAFLLLTNTDNTTDVVTDTDQGLERLAGLVPDDFLGFAWLNDHEAHRQMVGIPRPSPHADVGASNDYLFELVERGALPGSIFTVPVTEDGLAALRAELGIEPAQVTASASWGQPPDMVYILVGDFDPVRVDGAARALPDPWTEALSAHDHRGVTVYSWFEDFTQGVERSLPTNGLGSSRRLALVADHLIITQSTESMHRTIDSILDDQRSHNAHLVSSFPDPVPFLQLVRLTDIGGGGVAGSGFLRPGDDAGDSVELRVWFAEDASEVEALLHRVVDETAATQSWPAEWRDAVAVQVDAPIATIAVSANETMLAGHPDDPNEQIGQAVQAELWRALLDLDSSLSDVAQSPE